MILFEPVHYTNPGFIDFLMKNGYDVGTCQLKLGDGKIIELHTRVAIWNIIFWRPLIQLGLLPTIKEFFNIKYLTNAATEKVNSAIYERILDNYDNLVIDPKEYDIYMVHPSSEYYEPPTPKHMIRIKDTIIRMKIFYNIGYIDKFTKTYILDQLPSIDGLALAEIQENPIIKKIINLNIDDRNGTKVAEQQINAAFKEYMRVLNNPTLLPNNALYPYMQAGVLKSNQIPQMMIAYGPRSDINDEMKAHVIDECSFGGIRSNESFTIESLSGKKSVFFSKDVISKSQYFGRKMKLGCSNIERIYEGSCGSTVYIPFVIESAYASNFLGKMIMHNNQRIELTTANIKEFVDVDIQLISAFGCRHTDGICEHCAGYGRDRLIKYMPPGIHIGLLCSTTTSSIVSQLVLSAKHLICTLSKTYNLPDIAKRYFTKDNVGIYWDKELGSKFSKLPGYYMRIPLDAMGPLIDIGLEQVPIAETFSKIGYFELMYNDEILDIVHLESDRFVPYLSDSTLDWLRDNYEHLIVDENFLTIPLRGMNLKNEFFKYVILNDDISTYTNRVQSFLTSKLSNYTSIAKCLTDFAAIILSKADINIFFLEIVLRSMLVTSDTDCAIPVVQDPNNVQFGNLDTNISGETLAMKLSYERLKDYLSSPTSATQYKCAGLFGPFFGLIE